MRGTVVANTERVKPILRLVRVIKQLKQAVNVHNAGYEKLEVRGKS
jgi:hypothetical protein